jgi:predicted GIY-YIG superfamily endonuclease
MPASFLSVFEHTGETRSEAEGCERQLKGWARAKKWALACGDLPGLE